MANKCKHLGFIQGIINRLSTNSFLLEGWNVVLVSALFALAANNLKLHFVYLACVPAIAFWILDGCFLWRERLFRKLYDHVRALNDEEVDFSMSTSRFLAETASWWSGCLSKTLFIFHGTVLAAIIIVMVCAPAPTE